MSIAYDNFLAAHPGRDFDRNGLRLHYIDEGEGEPVVMVHGNPTWSFYYRNLIETLSGEYRTIALDHIGCGLSDKPDDEKYAYTLKSRVDDLEALLDHLELDRGITLVLHDWGGMIGMAYAARHPEQIARLVILNTGAFPLPKSKPFPWPLWICRNTKLGAWLVRGHNAFAGIAARVGCKRHPMSKDLRDAYTAPYDSWANRIATLRFVQDIPLRPGDRGYDIVGGTADRLKRFADVPMLIAWGLKDFVFDRHFLDEWTRRFPKAEVRRFEDCGHYILEDAGDEIIPQIQAFPRGKSGTPGGRMTGVEVANIASGLTAMARDRPDALAVLAPAGRDAAGRAKHVHWTFRQLELESNRVAEGLTSRGIGPGVRTVLMVKPSLSFFSLTFGLFKAGAVPVLVDPGLGIKNIGPCLAEAQPEAFIGIPKAQLARRILGWGKGSIRTSITIKSDWAGIKLDSPGSYQGGRGLRYSATPGNSDAGTRPGLRSTADPCQPVDPDRTAAILFTSGSTGVPKGAVYTHPIFHAQIDLLRRTYNIQPGEVDLCTFPLFALFGPILGMTCVVPEMDATRPGKVVPTKIIEAIEDFGVTNLFGSPALIRRVGDYGASKGIRLPSLRRVISAGAPVPARVLETFSRLLDPGVQIFTPYGATESLPVCSIGSDEILSHTRRASEQGAGVCVGRPVEGMLVELIAIQDEPIPTWSGDLLVVDGEAGEIVVRGPVVTRSYFNRPEATALAKIDDPSTGGFWHRMGDLGRRDKEGRIWFLGRKSHRVQTEFGTLFTIPCEGIFNVHESVARTALVGVGPPGKSKPVLCVEANRKLDAAGWSSLRSELLALAKTNPMTSGIETILFHEAFPVDIRHNAKIFREKLAIWAEGRLR